MNESILKSNQSNSSLASNSTFICKNSDSESNSDTCDGCINIQKKFYLFSPLNNSINESSEQFYDAFSFKCSDSDNDQFYSKKYFCYFIQKYNLYFLICCI